MKWFAWLISMLLVASALGQPAAPSPNLIQLRELYALKRERRAYVRIDHALLDAQRIAAFGRLTAHIGAIDTGVKIDSRGFVEVDLDLPVTDSAIRSLRGMGAVVRWQAPAYDRMRIAMPLANVHRLIEVPSLRWAMKVVPPITNSGSVDSEGNATHDIPNWRTQTGLSGAGVRVGVLSDSVDRLATAQATGDLPTPVDVVSGQAGTGAGEGTAMMEIIHDLAPGAALSFATGTSGEGAMAANVDALVARGCKVVVDDVTYPNEPCFQDGPVAKAFTKAAAAGVICITSAGDLGRKTSSTSSVWEGNFADSGQYFFDEDLNIRHLHKFAPGLSGIGNRAKAAGRCVLQWSDSWSGAANDYDLFITDGSGNFLRYSANGPGFPPIESTTVNANEYASVTKFEGHDDRFLRLAVYARNALETTTIGNVPGHNGALDAISIGATSVLQTYPNVFTNAVVAETFSPDGPRRIYYRGDGTAYSGDLLASGGLTLGRPDFIAADGVRTSAPAGPFNRFYGASAAAAHAAGMVALMCELRPASTLGYVRGSLQPYALDILPAGWDVNTGFGVMMVGGWINAYISSIFSQLTAAQSAVNGGETNTMTLNLLQPTPPAGLDFDLSYTGPVSGPASVHVPGGQTTFDFEVTSSAVSAPASATVSATQRIGSVVRARSFDVNAAPADLQEFTLTPTEVAGGNEVTGTITLGGLAGSGGREIELESSNPDLVEVPDTATVPQGENSVQVGFSTVAVTSPRTVTVTASQPGGISISRTVILRPAQIESLALTPDQVTGGTGSMATVTLTGPAPTGGLNVRVTRSIAAANVPANVLVPAGSRTVEFSVGTDPVLVITRPIIRVRRSGGSNVVATITILPPVLTAISATPNPVLSSRTLKIKVDLSGPAPAGYLFNLASSQPGLVAVPASANVGVGSTSRQLAIVVGSVTADRAVRITASRAGSTSRQVLVTIKP